MVQKGLKQLLDDVTHKKTKSKTNNIF